MTDKNLLVKDLEKTSERKFTAWGVLIFFVLLFIDQLTKAVADAYFSAPNAPILIIVIDDWLNLCITYNRGISYGMGKNAPTWAKIAVIIGTAVLMAAFAVYYFKGDKSRKMVRLAAVFVVAGGVGNLIDRVYYEVWDPNAMYGVRDMVDLSRFGFAVCNFADFFITGGAVMLILALLFFDKDAIFPVGKYRELAQAMAEEREAKEQERKEPEKKVLLTDVALKIQPKEDEESEKLAVSQADIQTETGVDAQADIEAEEKEE